MNKLRQLLNDNARSRGERTERAPVRAQATGDRVAVYVYDVIDAYWGASAKAVIEALQGAAGRPVDLHINTPGGDVFECRAMISALRAHAPGVTTYVDGLAASCGSWLMLAGDQVHIADGAMVMVHNSWTMTWGNKAELRSTADLLDKIDGAIVAEYARKTGKTAGELAALMDTETWLTAQEALAAGFVDAVDGAAPGEPDAGANRWNLAAYDNAPKLAPQAADTAAGNAAEQRALDEQAERVARLNRSRLALLQTTRI